MLRLIQRKMRISKIIGILRKEEVIMEIQILKIMKDMKKIIEI